MSNMINKKELSLRLGVSERHLDNLWRKGRVPQPVKLGSRVLWPEAIIDQWLATNCPSPATSGREEVACHD